MVPTKWLICADERSRTSDLLITNQLLYQLSYTGMGGDLKYLNQTLVVLLFLTRTMISTPSAIVPTGSSGMAGT